jgi:hypothetical protein
MQILVRSVQFRIDAVHSWTLHYNLAIDLRRAIVTGHFAATTTNDNDVGGSKSTIR